MIDDNGYVLTDPPRWGGERKTFAIIVGIFAVLGILVWVVQLRNTITAPYALKSVPPAFLKEELVDNNIEFLKNIDTTGNGLSDYEKVYVYGTSRYLYDTYGYGISDREVVAKGLPLCPGAGKNCGGIFSADGSYTGTVATTTLYTEEDAGMTQNPILNFTSPDALEAIFSDPTQLRQLLVQSGQVTEAELRRISDADLVKTARDLLATSTPGAVVPGAR